MMLLVVIGYLCDKVDFFNIWEFYFVNKYFSGVLIMWVISLFDTMFSFCKDYNYSESDKWMEHK